MFRCMLNLSSHPSTQLVYNFIVKYVNENKLPPTLKEISDGCYLSKTSVRNHLSKLEGKGLIELREKISRGIILLSIPV